MRIAYAHERTRADTKFHPSRQRFTLADASGKTLVLRPGQGVGDVPANAVLRFKDLGPQIGYRTVFLVEYGGPLVIHLLFFMFPEYIYPLVGLAVQAGAGHTTLQRVTVFLAVVHYGKRELESVFVHRFSNATMPIMNIFRNSAHYWILGGLMIAFPLYAPGAVDAPLTGAQQALVVLILLCQLGNLHAHIVLRNLRPPGTKEYQIPYGGMFALVSCPNYFYESLVWLCYALLTQSVLAGLFWVVGTAQMMQWAADKHAKYRQTFPNYPSLRKRMFPLLY